MKEGQGAAAPLSRSVRSCVPQLGAEAFAGPRQPRFHGADGNTERESNLFVAQAVDFPEHDGGLLIEWETIERDANPFGELLAAEQAVRRPAVVRLRDVAMVADVLIERDLLRAMAPPPRPLPVTHLVDDNPINPRAEAGLPSKGVNGAEHAQEHFLRQVERLAVVVEQVQRELVDHALVFGDQLGAGVFVASRAALNEGRLAPSESVQDAVTGAALRLPTVVS